MISQFSIYACLPDDSPKDEAVKAQKVAIEALGVAVEAQTIASDTLKACLVVDQIQASVDLEIAKVEEGSARLKACSEHVIRIDQQISELSAK